MAFKKSKQVTWYCTFEYIIEAAKTYKCNIRIHDPEELLRSEMADSGLKLHSHPTCSFWARFSIRAEPINEQMYKRELHISSYPYSSSTTGWIGIREGSLFFGTDGMKMNAIATFLWDTGEKENEKAFREGLR